MRTFLLTAMLMSTSPCFAIVDEPWLVRLQGQLETYFNPNSRGFGQASPFRDRIPDWPYMSIVIAELNRQAQLWNDKNVQNRVLRLLALTAEQSKTPLPGHVPRGDERRALEKNLAGLLMRYRHIEDAKEYVILLLDHLNMWSRSTLGYFLEELAEPVGLRVNARRIYDLMPFLNDEDRIALIAVLRPYAQNSTGAQALIVHSLHAGEDDLVRFFSLASQQFARRMHRVQEAERRPSRTHSPSNDVIARKLRHLKMLVESRDVITQRALQNAINQVRKDGPTDEYTVEERLTFYALFLVDRLDWHVLPTTLEAQSASRAARFKVEGNVIHVKFGCRDALED